MTTILRLLGHNLKEAIKIISYFPTPGINPLICLWLAKRDLRSVARNIDCVSALPETSPQFTLQKLQAATKALTELQIKNQWPYLMIIQMNSVGS